MGRRLADGPTTDVFCNQIKIMKISKIIERLSNEMEKHGDIECVSPSEGVYESTEINVSSKQRFKDQLHGRTFWDERRRGGKTEIVMDLS